MLALSLFLVPRLIEMSAGDHLALWMAYKGYSQAKQEGRDRQYCHSKFMSQSTLRMIAELKSQFFDLLVDIGFVGGKSTNCERITEKSPGTVEADDLRRCTTLTERAQRPTRL